VPVNSAKQALLRLREGNRRFASGEPSIDSQIHPSRRRDLIDGQMPFAIVLGCSDSRVPVELIFDQGLGELFVIRVAGNVVTPPGIGSVEFAAESFGVRLVVVLGHEQCGAVRAALDELRNPATSRSPNLRSITGRIRPTVEALTQLNDVDIDDALLRRAVRANVEASIDSLTAGSSFLSDLVARGDMLVVGAEYSLQTGEVTFHDENET